MKPLPNQPSSHSITYFGYKVLYTVPTQANCFQTLQKAFEFIIQIQYGLNSAGEERLELEFVFIW